MSNRTRKRKRSPYPPAAKIVDAIYIRSELAMHRENPVLEALPPIPDNVDVIDAVHRFPPYRPTDRNARTAVLKHRLVELGRLVHPFDEHIELAFRVSAAIRDGYVDRNPLHTGFHRQAASRALGAARAVLDDDLPIPAADGAAPLGFAMVGVSGMGKTTGFRTVLQYYPQVIRHYVYQGTRLHLDQIVWLRIECPPDGSLKSFCRMFFRQVDALLNTRYAQNYGGARATVDTMLIDMARVAAFHCIGILGIDDIHNLNQAKGKEAQHVLNFIRYLGNTMGVPIVPIGTFGAVKLLGSAFQNARRACAFGDFIWDRMHWRDPSHSDSAEECEEEGVGQFEALVETLWKYCYLPSRSKLTVNTLRAIYEETQGITDLIVKLFMLSQIRALALGEKSVSIDTLRSVAFDCFRSVRPLIKALRERDYAKVGEVDDLVSKLELEKLIEIAGDGSGDNAGQHQRRTPEGHTSGANSSTASTKARSIGVGRRRASRNANAPHDEGQEETAYRNLRDAGRIGNIAGEVFREHPDS
jgi:hypothetical protein